MRSHVYEILGFSTPPVNAPSKDGAHFQMIESYKKKTLPQAEIRGYT